MMKIKPVTKNQIKISISIIFAVVLVLLPNPLHEAHAFGIESITANAISSVFGWFLFLIFSAVGQIISLLAIGLYKVINLPIYPDGGTAVITESWKIMRNFANMFFIVALIIMAFATIFNITKYEARTLFLKLLISALLINFSLVLGVLVIQVTQVLSNTFLTAIGDISSRLGQGLINSIPIKPDQISAGAFANALDGTVFGTIITLIFSIVLLFTFMFSLLTAFIFALIRIPIIWALLVVSPIAWIMNIFPAGQGTFKRWWSMFIGWNMFLPIFLFFLYFGLYFLQNQGDVLSKIATQTANQPLGGTSFTLQILFFYVLAGVFLIGGTIVAMKASMFSGTGVVQVAKWSRGVAAKRLGLTQAGTAARERMGEIQKEGLPGRLGKLYGGEAGTARETARFRDIIGGITGGRTDARDRQLLTDVKNNKTRFESITDPAQLKARINSGSRQEQLAIREIMKDRGLLNSDELLETYSLYGGNRSLAGKQFARGVNYDQLSSEERKKWLETTVTDIETQQKILGIMADKRDPYMRDKENVKKALDFFRLEGEQRNILKKIEKYDLKMATELQIENKLIRGRDGQPITNLEDGLKEIIDKLKPDDLLEYTSTLTKDAKLQELVKGTLNKQKVEAILTKGTQNQLEAWGPLMKGVIEKMEQEKNDALKKQAEATEGAVERGVRRGLGGGGTPGGGTPPPAGPGPTIPPQKRPIGFAPPTNPNNTVDLRNKNNP